MIEFRFFDSFCKCFNWILQILLFHNFRSCEVVSAAAPATSGKDDVYAPVAQTGHREDSDARHGW